MHNNLMGQTDFVKIRVKKEDRQRLKVFAAKQHLTMEAAFHHLLSFLDGIPGLKHHLGDNKTATDAAISSEGGEDLGHE